MALGVDMAILWSLVRFLSLGYVFSATLSFLAGTLVSYRLSLAIAFNEHRLVNRHAEFLSFVAIGALGLAINAGVIFIAVSYLGLHFMLAKCVSAGFTFSCNFVARRQLLFVQRPSM